MSARYYAEINQADKFGNNAMSSALTAGHYDLALYIRKKGGKTHDCLHFPLQIDDTSKL